MKLKTMRSPLTRHQKNPILSPEDMPFPCYTVFNAGAILHEGEVILLLRVEDLTRATDFYVARSRDGINFTVETEPVNYPMRPLEAAHDAHRFDMRVTKIDGRIIVMHAVWLTGYGSCIATCETTDFKNFTPFPHLSVPSNRNAVLFPEKINGLYARLERPQDVNGSGRMWVSYSPDLEFWGRSSPIPIPKTNWQLKKSGAGAIPIKTRAGWLEIYHGTCMSASTENYFLGAVLLDLEDPSKIIAAPRDMILAAETPYECVGQVPNVVFTGGAVEMPDGRLLVYYGGADTRMCVAETTIEKMLDFCLAAR
jgi:beta-1,4-mannooligosaccharide/beta-1,4-mannosyl-N-acetylglucosamine phosphorylase